MNRSIPIILATATFLIAGCGYSQLPTAITKKHSHPSSATKPASKTNTPPSTVVATTPEKNVSYDGFSLRVPSSWTLGKQIKIYEVPATGEYAGALFPKLMPDAGPGITSDPGNESPFFSEQLQVGSGSAFLQVADLGVDGNSYSLQVTVPSSESALLRAAAASLRYPPIATVKDDVRLIQRAQVFSGATATYGPADRWLVIGGNPATMQEQYALFRSTDGGSKWTLLHWTDGLVQPDFPGNLGQPTVFFWSASDGILAVSSAFSSAVWLYRTTDGGTTLTFSTLSVPSQPSKAPAFSRSAQGVLSITVPLASGTFSASSTDNGKTWVPKQ
ncbi:MAG: sialidase family protein [Thermaerobacter sp.]|nr:sialidase family protein [Thermaerobacter sp.]